MRGQRFLIAGSRGDVAVVLAWVCLIVLVLVFAVGGPLGVPALLLLVLWSVLFTKHRQLWRALVAVVSVSVVPLILVGGARYLPSAWRVTILFVTVSAIVGIVIQTLVCHAWAGRHEHEVLDGVDEVAHTDVLNNLGDRDAWQFELDRDLARGCRTGEPVSIALIDIDSFETVDNVAGCSGENPLLSTIAQNWISVLRPEDMLARVGEQQFAVLISGCSNADAIGVIKRLRTQIPQPRSCSIGLATWNTLEVADQLIRRADSALHDAKSCRQRQADDEAEQGVLAIAA